MKRAIIVLLFLLIACTPQQQEEPSEPDETLTWIYHTGLIIEFPTSWQVVSFLSLSEGFYFQDEYGTFMLNRDARDHETMKRIYIDTDSSFVEIDTEDDIRLFRRQRIYEIEDYPELFEGITDVIEYVAFLPNETVLIFTLPIIPEFDAREVVFYDVLFSAKTFETDLNTFGFAGGQAVMVYSDGWEIVNWNVAGSPVLENGNLRLSIFVATENFYREAIARNEDSEREISTQEVIEHVFEANLYLSRLEGEIIANSRYGQVLYQKDSYFLLHLDNEMIIEISTNLDDESTDEDERIVMLMIDSILLNNRDDYHDTIELIVPIGMTND